MAPPEYIRCLKISERQLLPPALVLQFCWIFSCVCLLVGVDQGNARARPEHTRLLKTSGRRPLPKPLVLRSCGISSCGCLLVGVDQLFISFVVRRLRFYFTRFPLTTNGSRKRRDGFHQWE